ncbi:restriction endonuclease subunit S [Burkholderia pseudomallei]|uniref:restriction endonuclease subunit S n=1 Tax=Burkholderia pseudomallei TaxID=28450 RepID=UPI00201A956E|nr:restriction endonuclease subunit S [Burkholderia pseudomallei]MCL4670364.1 restriction endonuclease subunit S [Burkholderia pseudomallei]
MLWQEKRLRFVADLNPQVRVDLLETPDTELSFLPMESIGEDGTLNLDRTRPVAEVRNGYSYFEDGDVAFAKVTPCFENGKGAVMGNLEGGAGFGTTELTVLRPKADTNARFLHYVVLSERFRQLGAAAMLGAGGLKRVPDEFTRDFATPWPDVSAQARIAKFLDEKTARIEALIAKKEQLLAKLSEYRYSYASSLMTRGLNPNAAIAGTSFPEVNAVPSHWSVKRLKFLGEVRSGVAKGKDLGDKDTVPVPYLRVANVQDGYVDLTEVLEIEVGQNEVSRYLLQKGDVLMNEGGDNDKLGRGTVWEGQIDPCIHQNHVFAVRLFDVSLAEWVARFTSTDAARSYFFLRSKQSTNLASINQSNVRELPVPMPPAKERLAILEELRRSSAATTELIEHTQEHIARLREYRSSLISATVTGQLDVGAYKEAA